MRCGKLRHKVQIQSVTQSRDAHGGITETWATDVSWWAEFVSSSGREFYRAQQVHADMTHLLRMRYYSGLTTASRIVHDSRNLNVLSVVNVEERNVEMLVACKEDVS